MSTIKTIVRHVVSALAGVLAAPARCAAEKARQVKAAKIQQLEDDIAELKRKKDTWEIRRRQFEDSAARAGLTCRDKPQYRVMGNTIDALDGQIKELEAQLQKLTK